MDRLQSLEVFRQVATLGSFTRAAQALGLSVAMASKHVSRLEADLQVRLLNRSSRRLALTEAGAEYLREAGHALDTLATARAAAQRGSRTAQGVLRFTAPVWCATPRFAQLMARYQAEQPQVILSLHLENRHIDLVAEGLDLALRVTAEPQPQLIVRPLTPVRFHFVASPAYLARHGTPRSTAELAGHRGVLPNYTGVDSPLTASADSNNTVMLARLAEAGLGVAYLPTWLVDEALTDGRLVALLPDEPRPPLTLYAAYLNREYQSAKVRTFIDFLVRELQG